MNIAVLIPCYNEEVTVKSVIDDFKKKLPKASIYIYDNNSTDKTYQIVNDLINSGYEKLYLKKEYRQGKGNVVRSMFRDIDADIYILVDGDDTYPAEFVEELIKPIIDKEADIVIGDRLTNGDYKKENKRPLHNFGNNLVKNLINKFFKANLKDIMSGYRAFNKKFVKNFPVLSDGFEIETEMTLHALDKKFLIKEIPIKYRDRPEGSYSKLNTFSDGFRVLKTIFWIFKDYKPLYFFSILGGLFFVLSLLAGIPVIVEFLKSGFITKIPSAILAVGLMIISILSFFSGLILNTVANQHRREYELQLTKYKD